MADIDIPRFAPSLSQAELQRGYEKVSGSAPFSERDIRVAYRPYGLKPWAKRRKKSDSALYLEATNAVLKWFRQQEKAKAKAAAATRSRAARPQTAPAPRPAATAPAPVRVTPAAPKTPVYRPKPRPASGSGGAMPT